jgi:hypothetical protein
VERIDEAALETVCAFVPCATFELEPALPAIAPEAPPPVASRSRVYLSCASAGPAKAPVVSRGSISSAASL